MKNEKSQEHSKSGFVGICDDLVPFRTFDTITEKISFREGIGILAHRIGLTGPKILKALNDRYPLSVVVYPGLAKYRFRCFLKFDLVFSDILHSSYEELKHIGIGRRFLINRILRSVLSGICDAYDPTGLVGDFPVYSTLSDEQAARARKIQKLCLERLTKQESGLLHSLRVRMQRISTYVLLGLVERKGLIRKNVHGAELTAPGSGLKYFSRWLHECQKEFFFKTRKDDVKRRKKARKIRMSRRNCTFGHMRSSLLRRGLSDLKKFLDMKIPNWYRRPEDSDWEEGMRYEKRKPHLFKRKDILNRYGISNIPGLTESVRAEDCKTLRTDWRISEVGAPLARSKRLFMERVRKKHVKQDQQDQKDQQDRGSR